MKNTMVVLALLLLVGCNDAPQARAVTISKDYQNSIHAQNDAAFEYARLQREQHRAFLVSQH